MSTEEERARHRETMRRWRAANPERDRNNARRYRAENPEAVRAAQQRYDEKHPEKRKERDRARNTPEYRARRRAYWQQNGEKLRAWQNEWLAANPARRRGYWLRASHGMRLEDWAALWDSQDGNCYLCGDPLSADTYAVHIDHDHACCPPGKSCARCRRGLSCGACNKLIGQAFDDPDRLERIAAALRAAQQAVDARPKQTQLELFPNDRSVSAGHRL